MKIFNKTEKKNQINWLSLIVAFILGILIASNILLFWMNLGMQKEIQKLKSDDMALAQAVNSILNQIQPANQK
jgi:hypothetical protein